MTPCRSNNIPYVQCDCPVHDRVAELLDIDSTRVDGYKSTKSRGISIRDSEGQPITLFEARRRDPTFEPVRYRVGTETARR
jgi:hypothetical protein